METLTLLLHQGLLFVHLVTFAIALSAVLRADLGMLRARRLDVQRLARTARLLSRALAVLWLTGLMLLTFDVELDRQAWSLGAKAVAKVFVVTALTANGLALHTLVFPRLQRPGSRAAVAGSATLAVVLGAISTASWLFASFIGASRLVAPAMQLGDFLALYALALVVAIGVALVFVRRHVERLMLATGLL